MASSIFSVKKKNTKQVHVVRTLRDTIQIGEQSFLKSDLNPSLVRFSDFWDLMETVKRHGYLRAAMSVVGKSTIGAWWTLRKHPEYKGKSPERHRKVLFEFYMFTQRRWDNIKDFQSFAYKLMIGAMYLRYFGQVAYQIIRDEKGNAIGLDHLPGLIIPNVDAAGNFKTPAFVQYPTSDPTVRIEFNDPKDIVFIANPDWEGSPMGGTDIEALSDFALPIDIYLQTAAREYMKNRDTPEVVYQLPADISDEAFDQFVREMESRHAGPGNMGRNPIAVQGEFDVKELKGLPDSLPYQESRTQAREEELAVAGVSGSKLGITEALSNSNLKESRREFHETSMLPLFKLMELALYEQVNVREFGFVGWEFKFNAPDFLNAVERATVHMRYHQMGALNPNEIRFEIGKPARTDEDGNKYVDQQEDMDEGTEQPGSPPEGRPIEPDDPSQTGEPTLDDQDPERGDQHDDETREEMLREVRSWRAYAISRIKRGKSLREYRSNILDKNFIELVQSYLSRASTLKDVVTVFDVVLAELEA